MTTASRALLNRLAVLLALLLVAAGGARAQVAPPAATASGSGHPVAAAEAAEAAVETAAAPLQFENRRLFTFRASIGNHTPADRAAAALERVRRIVAGGGPLLVTTEAQAGANLMLIDGQPAFAILPGDVKPLLHETLNTLTADTVKAMQEAVAAYAEQRRPAALMRAAVFIAAATVAFLGVLWALRRARRAITRVIQAAVGAVLRQLPGRLRSVLSAQAIGGFGAVVVSLMGWLLTLLAGYVWLSYVLAAIPYTRPWGLQLEGFLLGTAGGIALAVARAVPGLFIVAIIVLLTRAASHVAAAFFDRVESGRISIGTIDAFSAPMTRRIVTGVLWLFALAMAYPFLPGAQSAAFQGVSVLAGLIISIGASSVVGQAASGLILTYAHAFKPGEYVRIGDTEGTLSAIGMFSTRIETGLGELVVLPNNYVLANTTKNYSRAFPGTGFVMDTTVTIGYSTPWRQVHAMLKQAALRLPGIAKDPAPRIAQTELSDFYAAYRLICCAEPRQPHERAALLSALHASIQDVFNENGVQIMSPHYMTDPAQAQVVPKARWYTPPADPPDEPPRRT